MELKFKQAIEEFYNIKIEKIIKAPRQFVAETHIIDDSKGNQYFCKLVDKPLFIPQIIESLPIVEEVYTKGISRISYPVRGKNDLYVFSDKTLIILYNYISAPQNFDYNFHAVGKVLAEIHNLTPQVSTSPPKESFEFPNEEIFNERFVAALDYNSDNAVMKEFKNLLREYKNEILLYKDIFLDVCNLCKNDTPNLVLTHGDVYTNILVKSPYDIYIIDWDELRLAPAERDLWMHDEVTELLEGYKIVIPNFVINKNMRSFCILQYYFERMNYYFSDILNESLDDEFRLLRIKKLGQNRMAGWILPKVEEVKVLY